MGLLFLWRRAMIERICAKVQVYVRNERFDFKFMKKIIFFRDTNVSCVHCKKIDFSWESLNDGARFDVSKIREGFFRELDSIL